MTVTKIITTLLLPLLIQFGVITKTVKADWQGLIPMGQNLIQMTNQNVLQPIGNFVGNFANTMGQLFKNIGLGFHTGAQKFWNKVKPMPQNIWSGVQGLGQQMGDFYSNKFAPGFNQFFSNVFQGIGKGFNNLWGNAVSGTNVLLWGSAAGNPN